MTNTLWLIAKIILVLFILDCLVSSCKKPVKRKYRKKPLIKKKDLNKLSTN